MKENNQKKKRGLFAWCFQTSLLTRIFVGLILGAVVGLAVGPEIAVTNPLNAAASGQILPTIFFAIVFGIGISYLKESSDKRIKNAAQTVFTFFEGGAEIMYKVVTWVLEYAPIGVFALIAVVFGKQGAQAFGPLLIVTVAVYINLYDICMAGVLMLKS